MTDPKTDKEWMRLIAPLKAENARLKEELRSSEDLYSSALQRAQARIAELGGPRWVSASERLPDGDDEYLVQNSWYEIFIARFSSAGPYWTYSSTEFKAHKSGIVAWMPLPEPFEKAGVE